MKTRLLLVLVGILALLTACTRSDRASEWWVGMTGPKKQIRERLNLTAGAKVSFTVSGDGMVRLGVLVREVEEMRRAATSDQNQGAIVYLVQVGTNDFVGTYYSASFRFDLSKGREFTVENRSRITSDLIVYQESE